MDTNDTELDWDAIFNPDEPKPVSKWRVFCDACYIKFFVAILIGTALYKFGLINILKIIGVICILILLVFGV